MGSHAAVDDRDVLRGGCVLTLMKLPLCGTAVALGILFIIDKYILPLHHTPANMNGILLLECVVLLLLFGGLVWDKSQAIRDQLHSQRRSHDELFTWKEIGKVLACFGASMFIFVAVVKVLDLKAEDHLKHAGREDTSSVELR